VPTRRGLSDAALIAAGIRTAAFALLRVRLLPATCRVLRVCFGNVLCCKKCPCSKAALAQTLADVARSFTLVKSFGSLPR